MLHFIRMLCYWRHIANKSIKSKLIAVNEEFAGFDRAFQAEQRKRELKQQQILDHLHNRALKLQESLASEVKARSEDMKQLQALTEIAANAVLERIQESFMRELAVSVGQYEQLNNRLVNLENSMKQFTGELPSSLLVESAQLMKQASLMKSKCEELSSLMGDREHAFQKRISEFIQRNERNFNHSASENDRKLEELAADAEDLSKPHDSSKEDQFRDFVIDEFSNVKAACILETEARLKADNEILEAIQFYSDALKKHVGNFN
jgi:SF-assemblin/beta giardin